MGLPLFAMCVIGSVRSKMQVNWPAAAYFSWMILAAYFLGTRLRSAATWKPWRGWFWGAVVFGLLMMPVAHDFEILYPMINRYNAWRLERAKAQGITDENKLARTQMTFRRLDPTAKLKGWKELGARVTREMEGLKDPFVLCEEYMQTAEMAFYVEGQPKTYCVGAYVKDVKDRRRRTQYDVWPDRDLSQPHLRGRDAIYVGFMNDTVREAFESVEALPEEQVIRHGGLVRKTRLYRCRGFRGLTMPESGGTY
jgi:hypothetical protein